MSAATEQRLAVALAAPATVARYWAHIQVPDGAQACWWWTGAVSGHGHGRFHLSAERQTGGDGRTWRRNYTIIAHRFGYALAFGLDALGHAPVVAHRCDNTLCQRPDHWRESTQRDNRRDYYARRALVLGPLADRRGARGRARALRDALRDGHDVDAAILAGALPVHRNQLPLFD